MPALPPHPSSHRTARRVVAGIAVVVTAVLAGDAALAACGWGDSASQTERVGRRRHHRTANSWWSWGASSTTVPDTSSTVPGEAPPDTSEVPPSADPTVPAAPGSTTPPAPGGPVSPPPSGGGGWWKPSSATPLALHWVLGGPLDLNDPVAMGLRAMDGSALPEPDVYDIDGQMNSAETVAALHARGKKVICYFDAGVFETYRPDAGLFPASVIGNADAGWDGSFWLDIRRIDVLEPIMRARIADCKAKGFDAIEPDEIDGYENDPGFPLTYQDQLAYDRAVATWAHEAGMSIGQKGNLDQTRDLVDWFDWTLNEECGQYNECTTGGGGLQLYSEAGKAVWIAEYQPGALDCNLAVSRRWNASLYELGLPTNGGRQPCGGW